MVLDGAEWWKIALAGYRKTAAMSVVLIAAVVLYASGWVAFYLGAGASVDAFSSPNLAATGSIIALSCFALQLNPMMET